jgi:hypothetical protein
MHTFTEAEASPAWAIADAAALMLALPVLGVGVALGLGDGVIDPPPDVAVTVATPERLSDTRFTRTTPSFVFPCSGIVPRSVKNWTTVPSATGVPAGSIKRAEMTEEPPFAGMKPGFAFMVRVVPAGAVMIAWLQVKCESPRSARAAGTATLVHFMSVLRIRDITG